ncbi:MAG: hypothetical protein L6U16_13490 [Porphyromonadaceae bacterium]|nr:MAG: hypothetical protein L6U16_13490 [Porphyromonadaceae bacterium]
MASCGDDNKEPQPETVTRSAQMINHIVKSASGEVLPLSESKIDYTIDRNNRKVTEVTASRGYRRRGRDHREDYRH